MTAIALDRFQIRRAAAGKPAAPDKCLDSALGASAGLAGACEIFHAPPRVMLVFCRSSHRSKSDFLILIVLWVTRRNGSPLDKRKERTVLGSMPRYWPAVSSVKSSISRGW